MSGYRKLKEIVSAFEVVNDCAERAIKMITDFKDATTNVEEQEFLLQILEDNEPPNRGLPIEPNIQLGLRECIRLCDFAKKATALSCSLYFVP
ncbi:hypothetical protein OUZ56_026361 [Daphnia magna]|uniref:Uncharacterized protein n=1 Tax=Daphnia magna TaxID=35525 RepID=A0ABQ9ZLY8_9CRUS|nr:hypothetical protein OUZ56_026361 [Daphnia magna]